MNTQNKKHSPYENTSRYLVVLRFVLTWLLVVAIFVIIFSSIEFTDVLRVMKRTDIRFLSAAIAFSFFAHVIFSSARYQKVIESLGCRISFFESVIIRMGCNPIKGILPFKTGELAIAAYMNKKHNLSYSQGLFSLLFGYIFSLMVLMIFYFCGGIFYFHDPYQKIIHAAIFMLVLFLAMPLNFKKISQRITGCLKRYQKQREDLTYLIEKYDTKTITNIFIFSSGIETSKLLIIFAVLKSFHVTIPVEALLLPGSITIIAVYLPITYWGLGVRESAILLVFSSYATPETLLAGSLLITFIDGVLPVLLGLFFIKPFLNGLWEKEKEGRDVISNSP